jgi:tetratricopeptide (TPR) repeat protein
VQQIARHQWLFNLPRITEEVHDRFDEAIDWMEADPRRAALIFSELVREYPEHIDAEHHLALALSEMGRKKAAFEVWEASIKLALQFFPPQFSMDRDRLEWGFLENRPFLRLYHSYGLALMEQGRVEDALEVFENILGLNPNDNQGVRALAVGCHFELNAPEGVLSVCRQYPNDGLEQLMFGRALALFQLGKLDEAGKALDQALQTYPLIGAELLKKQHPRPPDGGGRYVTMGSPGQAYLYWREQGSFWRRTKGATAFLRERMKGGEPSE